jgi:phosphate-selective porin OprO/OprP
VKTTTPHVFSDSNDHVDYRGWYAQASYFITGEHRPYDQKTGTFSAVAPRENLYDKKKGWGTGAWEVVLRYDKLDLDDDRVDGGEMDDITVGLNWYLNKNAKVMMNYINTDIDRNLGTIYTDRKEEFDDDEGDVDAFLTRFQIFW